MLETTLSSHALSLIASAETMAFVSLLPADAPALPDPALCARIAFTGPFNGTLQLLAPPAFGALLAANMLGCDASDPDALDRAEDALKELMNIACGDWLAARAETGQRGFEMGLPLIEALPDAGDWATYLQQHPADAFDAEGHPLVIRFTKAT